jgi:alkylresorcinol/alkylpyrone synthase
MNMSSQPTDTPDPVLASVQGALPGRRYDQGTLLELLLEVWHELDLEFDEEWVRHFFEAVGVDGRHLAVSPETYLEIDNFGRANDHFVDVATDLGTEAVDGALERAGLAVDDVDAIFFTTVTGVASPSIDAKVANALELPRQIRRTPMFGLGCVGGAAGVARMADYLRGHPDDTAVLLSAELCSLTLERRDPSVADYVAAALFGDGASAVVGMGGRAAAEAGLEAAPTIRGSRSYFYRDTEWVMGWDVGADGFGLVLSGDLPEVIESELGGDLDAFLDDRGRRRSDIDEWISHPGGPKVLEAIESTFELEDDELELAWDSMHSLGNLSSASVLFVLEEAMRRRTPSASDDSALLMAMGPGFSAEFVLMDW